MKSALLIITILAYNVSIAQAKVDTESCNKETNVVFAILKCNPVGVNLLLVGLSIYMPQQMLSLVAFGYSGYILPGQMDQVSMSTTHENKEAVRTLINNDITNYYANGELSPALLQTINVVKENNNELSDTDALEYIATTLNVE